MAVGDIGGSLLRRRVLLTLLVVGAAGTGFGMWSGAFFQDSDPSAQNAVQAGTLDLKLDGADSADAVFSATNAGPTDATRHNYTLRNNGSLAADHVEVSLSFAANDSRSEPSDSDLNTELNASETATLLNVTTLEYQNESGAVIENVLDNVSDQNGNGIVDLADVKAQSGSLDDLAAPQANKGNSTYLVIELKVASDDGTNFLTGGNTEGNLTGYDEDVMADGVDVKLTVTLNEDSSQ